MPVYDGNAFIVGCRPPTWPVERRNRRDSFATRRAVDILGKMGRHDLVTVESRQDQGATGAIRPCLKLNGVQANLRDVINVLGSYWTRATTYLRAHTAACGSC